MPISGIVVTLNQTKDLPALASDPRLTLGEPNGLFVPAVLETATLEEAEEAVQALMAADHVRFVDVVTVDFSDGLEATELAPLNGDAAR